MGTNYYIIKRKDNNIANKLWNARNAVINNTQFVDAIANIIKSKFKKPLTVALNNDLDTITEEFNERLEEAVKSLASDIEYDISYVFDLWETKSVHIGKSSVGWLFNFQIQDTEIDGVKIKWKSYEDVMSFLYEYVCKKKEFVIIDEYYRKISYTSFKDLVDSKQKDKHNLANPDNFHYCQNFNGYRFSDGDFS